jgi:hypothetical protein
MIARLRRAGVLALVATIAASAPIHAQGKTDVVTLRNGDHITGEVVRLDRGRLEFSTDDEGTLYLEWDKVRSVVAMRQVEVVTTDGRRFLGSLGQAPDNAIVVVSAENRVPLQMTDVAMIRQIGTSFWNKLDGSIDAGFSYTQSSGVAQINVNSETTYEKPASKVRLAFSYTQTETSTDEGSNSDHRASAELSYLRYPWQRWFIWGATRFETNQSLGIELRSQVGGAVGPRLVNTSRAQVAAGGGLVWNDERGVDVAPTQNVEGLVIVSMSYYTYDRPKTNLDFYFQYYPSFSNWGRQRIQLDTGVKRELLKDFFVGLSVYDSYDSRPPNESAHTNDIGIVASIGWSY